jgi:hypothetical protein
MSIDTPVTVHDPPDRLERFRRWEVSMKRKVGRFFLFVVLVVALVGIARCGRNALRRRQLLIAPV